MKKDKQLQKLIKKLVDLSFKDGKIVENQVIKSIKSVKSAPKPQAIWALSEYLKQLKRKERQFTMYIESAIPLSPIQVMKMKRIVEKKAKITKVLVNINPEILGGFKLRLGDEIWDESLVGKIQQVKEVIHGRSNKSN
ncbi:F0F1 ATP synthase subunit delta [Candidatus Daviesbacteria bacterium]|nr:F0F1 ATP synthase subunit delta [Candidatus Daviesbacteria bacterium]